jgi:hypothetical protein
MKVDLEFIRARTVNPQGMMSSAQLCALAWAPLLLYFRSSLAAGLAPGVKCYVLQHDLSAWPNGFQYEAGFPADGLASTGCPPQYIKCEGFEMIDESCS